MDLYSLRNLAISLSDRLLTNIYVPEVILHLLQPLDSPLMKLTTIKMESYLTNLSEVRFNHYEFSLKKSKEVAF
jgi:hypothetical protein